MALLRKLFHRKPPDGLVELCERVYVFDCCFNTNAWEEERYKVYVGGVIGELKYQYTDASVLVFNFREGQSESLIANVLSEYDITIMDYPWHYAGCPLLSLELIHHFLRSSESWLSLGQQNVLLMHCEMGCWPVLAAMQAALLIYRKQFNGELKTLDMVYRRAPRGFLHCLSPLNPIPSQLRYLQYVSSRNDASEWPPLERALSLDCVVMRRIPDFDSKGGCCPIFRIYGQDRLLVGDRTPKVIFSTPKRSKAVRHYKQAEHELIKMDICCHVQGDVVLECINLYDDMERENLMFRVMFNTAFVRSNILMLNRGTIDIQWDAKDQFAEDFRVEVIFSETAAAASLVPVDLSCFEEKDGLAVEAFAKVQEIFSSVDWLAPRADVALNMLQRIAESNIVEGNLKTEAHWDPTKAAPVDNTNTSTCLGLEKLFSKPSSNSDVNEQKTDPQFVESKSESVTSTSSTQKEDLRVQSPPPSTLIHSSPTLPLKQNPNVKDGPPQPSLKISSSLHPPPPPPSRGPSSFSDHVDPALQKSMHVSSAPPPLIPSIRGDVKLAAVVPPSTLKGGLSGAPSPPPPIPINKFMSSKNRRTKKLKPLLWSKIKRAEQGSLWAEAQKSGEASKVPEIDKKELESLFEVTIAKSHARLDVKPKQVHLIKLDRARNCEIILKRVKIPLHDLVSSVLNLEDSALDIDLVGSLTKLCPTKQEMGVLKGYKGEKDKLGRCEQYFYELMQVPRMESKFGVISFKIQFHSQVFELNTHLNVVNSAVEQIRSSAKLQRIMQTILSLGNVLNEGTERGAAAGFKLDSLLKLTETRDRNNMTLMHYLCKVLADKMPELLDFSNDLDSLEAASKIEQATMAVGMQSLSKGLKKVAEELSMSEGDGHVSENFSKAVKKFLCLAEPEVSALISFYSVVGRNLDALFLYLGEDPSSCQSEKVFSLLLNFVRMFNKAQEENCKQLELEMSNAEKGASSNEKLKRDGA